LAFYYVARPELKRRHYRKIANYEDTFIYRQPDYETARTKLIKKLDFGNWGGYQARFGDLDKNGSMDVVVVRRRNRNSADTVIGSIVAYDIFEDRLLWTRGDLKNTETTNFSDLPIQVYDLDGDGYPEVIAVMDDNEIHIMNGQTGKTIKKKGLEGEEPNPIGESVRVNYHDAIIIANVSGKKRPADIIVKNRYSQLLVLDNNLEEIARFGKHKLAIVGHCPINFDFDGDGRDEIMWGRGIIKLEGDSFRELWETPMGGHMDCLEIDDIDGKSENGLEMALGANEFYMLNTNGEILGHLDRMHAQIVAVGKFREDIPGKQIAVFYTRGTEKETRYALCMYDSAGRELWELPPEDYNEGTYLVNFIRTISNWQGEGKDSLLVSRRAEHMDTLILDGFGHVIERLPGPVHITKEERREYQRGAKAKWSVSKHQARAIDLVGDSRPEIVLWNIDGMIIYQNNRPSTEATVKPKHWSEDRELYNDSGYCPQPVINN